MVDGEIQIQQRLDRFVVDSRWLECWPDSVVRHLPRVGSNHNPLLLSLTKKPDRTGKLFKFEAELLRDPKCEEVVKKSWGEGRGFSALSRWQSSLSQCRKNLLKWRKKFQNNKVVINQLLEELNQVQLNP